MFDYLIVGAGFAGSVLAERLAAVEGKKVLLIDKRNHIGGNAYDFYDEAGILIHKYGPHIFHTNSAEVFNYLAKFTDWRNYQHKVLAHTHGQYVPIPINLTTINDLYGKNLDSSGVTDFFAAIKEDVQQVKTSEDVVVKAVGRELYETFFKGYTKKQWDLDPSELDASVASRVPTRTNKDDRYFTDTYQAMPLHGFTKMFEKMLSHPNIKLMLNTDYHEIMHEISFEKMIFTGPVDEYFDFCFGKLPYRSINFKFETLDQKTYQRTGTINYPNDYDFTRITEFKYLTGQKHKKTTVVYEFPKSDGDPYYPIPRPENNELYKKYQALASQSETIFVGRLATYKYYNMDQVVAQALSVFKKIKQENELNLDPERVASNSSLSNE
ncbi:UDP-galactopyranose mutase [Mucilaginibacter corticis]|uniref:UDP-galactopyranose mutase n=1 Tax=Mucilaginibacter corticis TaxID=2597670 RepID=A0A556M8T9_9SPHI|nr:UDP-galactopyranose mutase [Mucilaginibacter corticis]TSJ36319.1 UDP-galactopyranose mutase [Mucilaginibacter corticis]